jgi:hypothetical protein
VTLLPMSHFYIKFDLTSTCEETYVPSKMNRLVVARPMPLFPPVITATFPSSLFMILLPFGRFKVYELTSWFWVNLGISSIHPENVNAMC